MHIRPHHPIDPMSPDVLGRAVEHGTEEARRRNGVTVGRVRIGLSALLFALALSASALQTAPGLRPVLVVLAVHLVGACAAAALLGARWRVEWVAFLAAAFDVAAVGVAGVLVTAGPVSSAAAGYMAALMALLLQVVLLSAAVVTSPRLVCPLGVAALGLQAVFSLRADIPPLLTAMALVASTAFELVVLWTGSRVVSLAAGVAAQRAAVTLAEGHALALEDANRQIAAQRDQLVAAQNEAEALAQVLVHDLKSPLSTLLQYVELAEAELRPTPAGAGPVDHLENAVAEGRRLSRLIGDLLLVYRLEQGAMAPRREPVPVRVVLESVRRRFAPRAAERGAALELVCDDLTASLDLDLAQRMLENLVGNAMRHVGREDRVRLEARAEGREIRLAVRNSGPPVPADLRGRLFSRFATGGVREWTNAGLGLYLCRLVAEAHAGSIELVERPGWNVSFEVTLPAGGEGGAALTAAAVSGAP